MSHLIELSTEVVPPSTFTVDGNQYQLLGFEHLSKNDEARVTALFARYTRMSGELGHARSQDAGEKIARILYSIRMDIMSTLTDLPKEIAERLPISAQTKLMNAIRQEVGGEEDDPGEGSRADEDDPAA